VSFADRDAEFHEILVQASGMERIAGALPGAAASHAPLSGRETLCGMLSRRKTAAESQKKVVAYFEGLDREERPLLSKQVI
jgi:DNA-binding GntR family transcriptional regulator